MESIVEGMELFDFFAAGHQQFIQFISFFSLRMRRMIELMNAAAIGCPLRIENEIDLFFLFVVGYARRRRHGAPRKEEDKTNQLNEQ